MISSLSRLLNRKVLKSTVCVSTRLYSSTRVSYQQSQRTNNQNEQEGTNNSFFGGRNFWILVPLCWGGAFLLLDADEELEEYQERDLAPLQGTVTDQVFLDIQRGEETPSRIVIGLYGEVCPKTVLNFKSLCQGFEKPDKGLLSYKNCNILEINPGLMLLTGDNTQNDGTGGESIFSDQGGSFRNENFQLNHLGCGVVSMVNIRPGENSSLFFIAFRPVPLDGKCVVFGQVIAGLEELQKLEYSDGKQNFFARFSKGNVENLRIVNCGVLSKEEEVSLANRKKL
jgi:cyclophilin family peptidyl-prolyl cis-trans isomerase